MSITKAKQIKHFQALPDQADPVGGDERLHAIQFESISHREAHSFISTVHTGLGVKKHLHKWISKGPKYKKRAKDHIGRAASLLERKFLEAYDSKDGRFFRALGDMLEKRDQFPINDLWSELERYIYYWCAGCKHRKLLLPSPSEVLSAWKSKCGFHSNLADIQIKQVQDAARNVGFNLPVSRRRKKSRG